MEVKIVIPTMGRAETITSHKYVKNCIICAPEKEIAKYQDHNKGDEIISHPDSILGIGLKRQWIFNKFGDVFMMDDDLKGLSRLTQVIGETQYLTPDQCYWIIQSTANMARLTGTYLFGYNNFVRPEHYHGHTPFALTGYINGAGLGLLKEGKKLKFNPEIKTNNDFYICALNAFHYRKCFIDKRYCMNQDSFANNSGGCSDVRTNKVEEEDYKLLRYYFGSAISIKTGGNTKAKHKFSKNLTVPY